MITQSITCYLVFLEHIHFCWNTSNSNIVHLLLLGCILYITSYLALPSLWGIFLYIFIGPWESWGKFIQSILELILMIIGWGITCEIVLRWMTVNITHDKSILVQVMAWCHQATNHELIQCSDIYIHMLPYCQKVIVSQISPCWNRISLHLSQHISVFYWSNYVYWFLATAYIVRRMFCVYWVHKIACLLTRV